MASVDLLALIGFVLVISLSGVLMPGPMTAATVVRSYTDKWAGAKVAIGHAFVELPLYIIISIVMLAIGSAIYLQQYLTIVDIIGILGGAYLLYFGISMLRNKDLMEGESNKNKLTSNAIVLGVTTSLFNPGFLLWWITIGTVVVTRALEFGVLILIIIWPIHWLCDFGWGVALSFGIQKAKQFYASQVKEIIRYGCAILILFFGLYFALSSGWSLLS